MRSILVRVVTPVAQTYSLARPAASSSFCLATRQRHALASLAISSHARMHSASAVRTAHPTPAASFSAASLAAAPILASDSSSAAAASDSSSTSALTTPPPSPIFLTTRDSITGRRITSDLGLVAASAFRSRNLLIDVLVAVTRIFGGETPDYTMLLNECTVKASQRLEATARAAGATSVVGVRFVTTSTMNRMIVGLHVSVLASGTAVIDVPEEQTTAHAAPPTHAQTRANSSHAGKVAVH